MTSQVFDFKVGGRLCFVHGHAPGRVTLNITTGKIFDGVDATWSLSGMTPTEARAIANSLYEAADFAERTLPAVATGEAA